MADRKDIYLWNVSFYNMNSKASQFMDMSSYRSAYVIAPTIEEAQVIASKNAADYEIVDSVSRINSDLYT